MKVKDVKKEADTKEGGEAMKEQAKEEAKKALDNIGFLDLERSEGLKRFGRVIWDILPDYEVWVEPRWERKPFETFDEGIEVVMEFPSWLGYTEVYRVGGRNLYVIHVSTGPHKKYFRIWAYDKNELEEVGRIEVSEGFLFVGDRYDLEEVLPKALKILDPPKIRIY